MRTASNTEDWGQSRQTEQCKSEEADYTGRKEQQTYHKSSSFIAEIRKDSTSTKLEQNAV